MAENNSPAALLNSYSVQAVRQIAVTMEIEGANSLGKPEMIKRLAQRIGTPAAVERALNALSPLQRAVLDRLMEQTQPVLTDIARTYLTDLVDPAPRNTRTYAFGNTVEPGDPDRPNSKRLQDIVAALTAQGLVFAQPASGMAQVGELGLRDLLIIPDRVRKALLANYPDTPSTYQPEGEQLKFAAPRQIYRDMFRLWTQVRRKPVTLTNAGLLRKPDARTLGTALGLLEADDDLEDEGDLPYLIFLREQMARLSLLRLNGQRIESGHREVLREYFDRPWPERSLDLLRSWLRSGGAEEEQTYFLPGGGYITLRPSQIQASRQKLLGHLQRLPQDWVRLADFERVIRLHDPQFLVDTPARSNYYAPYLYGNDWSNREGTLVRGPLITFLHWLGVIDQATDERGRLLGFRLTALGAALLPPLLDEKVPLDPAAFPPDAGGRVIVQPNFQILAVGDVADDVLLRLSEVAEMVRVDQAVEFKLTRAAVQAAQQAGWTEAEIVEFLRRASDAPLAQNVERSLRDWTAALERVLIRRNAGVLLALEPESLDRLENASGVAPWIGGRPLPGIAVLRLPTDAAAGGQSLAALRAALAAQGELPAATDIRSAGPVAQFTFADDGLVDFTVPLPDLRLLGLLSTVAAPGSGGLRLDEGRVRAAAQTRRWKIEDVNRLLAELADWHAGPLPPAIEARVKNWSGFYGRAALRTVTLLVVDREDLLAELQADPEIGPLLKPLGSAGAAAIIGAPEAPRPKGRARKDQPPAEPAAEDPAARLRRILAERGFSVEG